MSNFWIKVAFVGIVMMVQTAYGQEVLFRYPLNKAPEFVDRVNRYFGHKLGNTYVDWNCGNRAGTHNDNVDTGTDFALDDSEDREVVAAASGRVKQIANTFPDDCYSQLRYNLFTSKGMDVPKNWKAPFWCRGNGFGNYVWLRHENGTETIYAHLKKDSLDTENLKPGALVTCGQFLGLGGNSGVSTGKHLHFEVRDPNGDGDNKSRVDPYGGPCNSGASYWVNQGNYKSNGYAIPGDQCLSESRRNTFLGKYLNIKQQIEIDFRDGNEVIVFEVCKSGLKSRGTYKLLDEETIQIDVNGDKKSYRIGVAKGKLILNGSSGASLSGVYSKSRLLKATRSEVKYEITQIKRGSAWSPVTIVGDHGWLAELVVEDSVVNSIAACGNRSPRRGPVVLFPESFGNMLGYEKKILTSKNNPSLQVITLRDNDKGVLGFRVIDTSFGVYNSLRLQDQYFSQYGRFPRRSFDVPVYVSQQGFTYLIFSELGEIYSRIHVYRFGGHMATPKMYSVDVPELRHYGGGKGCYIGYKITGFSRGKIQLRAHAKNNFESEFESAPHKYCGSPDKPMFDIKTSVPLDI